jgi:flavin-dependent dehydrogenase
VANQSRVESVDVAVIGGGPAGAAAARLLGLWGRRVLLINRRPTRSLGESLPPSCGKLLDRLGVRELVEAKETIRATGNTVHWGASATENRVERFVDGALGWQVERNIFDRVLRDAAGVAGAIVWPDVVARTVTPIADEWRVDCELPRGGGQCAVMTRWVFDCSGRAGVLARTGFRRAVRGARTLALAGVWENTRGWPVLEPTHTIVESYDEGWAWSVPVSPTRRYVTVMIDPTHTVVSRQAGLASAYHAELERTDKLRALVHGATLCGAPWARDASPYSAARFADGGVLLVGDAGSFVDPLSSYGVKKALASAWLAAVAVNSAMSDSSITSQALELFQARERAMYSTLQHNSAALAHDVANEQSSGFWRDRSADDDVSSQAEPNVSALRTDPRVLAALGELRRRPSIQLTAGSGARSTRTATVRDDRVVVEDHLELRGYDRAIRYLRNVDLVLLMQLAPQHRQLPDLFEAYNTRTGPSRRASLPDFLGALSTLVGFEILAFA